MGFKYWPRWLPVMGGPPSRHPLYNHVFEYATERRLKAVLKQADVPEISMTEFTLPLIVQAELNSVELLEAIVKPPQPLRIYKTRHIRRRLFKERGAYDCLSPCERYAEYLETEGLLERDGEVTYTLLTWEMLWNLNVELNDSGTTNFRIRQLHYISVPLGDGRGKVGITHPWALVWLKRDRYSDNLSHADDRQRLLERYELTNCKFERSLLEPGVHPVPELYMDVVLGKAGTRPDGLYYRMRTRADKNRQIERDSEREMEREKGKELQMEIEMGLERDMARATEKDNKRERMMIEAEKRRKQNRGRET